MKPGRIYEWCLNIVQVFNFDERTLNWDRCDWFVTYDLYLLHHKPKNSNIFN